jgi:hypothetical protein
MSCADGVAAEGSETVLVCSVITAPRPFVRGDNGSREALPCEVRDGDYGAREVDLHDGLSKSNVANISLHTLINVVATVLIVETGTRHQYISTNGLTFRCLRFACARLTHDHAGEVGKMLVWNH